MNNLITELIHSSNGYFYKTAGVMLCFFDDPEQARCCANKITLTFGKSVNVCGSRLSISE